MIKHVAVLFSLILLSLALVACQFYVDKSQPWQDDRGVWHSTPVCGDHPYTSYTTILADDDERDSSGTSWVSYHHYKKFRKSSHTYVTIPVQTSEWSCTYV